MLVHSDPIIDNKRSNKLHYKHIGSIDKNGLIVSGRNEFEIDKRNQRVDQ